MRRCIGVVVLVGCIQAWPGAAEEWLATSKRGNEALTVERSASAAIDIGDPPRPDSTHADLAPPLPQRRPTREAVVEPARPPQPWSWRVLQTEWSEADERGFEQFVRRIGESDCQSIPACLASTTANPEFHATDPPDMRFYADCADLPYLLRAYYAWKKGLPFSFASAMRSLGSPGDLRYNASGNQVASRRDLAHSVLDARRAIPEVTSLVTSAQFRTAPQYRHALLPDHYPVGITRASIKSGTVIYDAYGHIAVVYDVTPEGRVLFMDSHPDNSLTRGLYGRAFHRQAPQIGGGFKRWRPLKLVGATRRPDGSYAGGRIELARDRELPDWSDEQYYGTERPAPADWRAARFTIRGEEVDYYRFVRLRLAPAGFRYDPLQEARTMLRNLCRDIHYRRDAVDLAIRARLHRRAPPGRLPYNIYGTDGVWEVYSTPSRDARLKTEFKELRDEMARFLELVAAGSDDIRYAGDDLRRDLHEVYRAETQACSIAYTRSNGGVTLLTFDEVAARLFDMSFDPYHCPERRWGATSPQELASCPDNRTKQAWYAAQRRLRNQIDRVYEARMDFTLAQLKRHPPGSGVDAPPDIDVWGLLGRH
jgi:hypothetical protein